MLDFYELEFLLMLLRCGSINTEIIIMSNTPYKLYKKDGKQYVRIEIGNTIIDADVDRVLLVLAGLGLFVTILWLISETHE